MSNNFSGNINLSFSPRKGFNPLTHVPPKYNIFGFLKPQNYLINNRYNNLSESKNIIYPRCSKGYKLYESTPMTRTKLLEERKKANLPDISYDLDGDGYVGGHDLVLAKRFDVDKDGKLNEIEKKNAIEGIKNGVENEYRWNLDNHGAKGAFRTIQKRGKIIDSEDFTSIQDTYPKHPLSEERPKNGIRTLKELKDYRNKKNREELEQYLSKIEKIYHSKYSSECQIENNKNTSKPLFSSINEIKKALHRKARINAGLEPEELDINTPKGLPSLNYIYSPKHKVREELKNEIKKENLEKSMLLSNKRYMSDVERLNKREDEIFNKLFLKEEGLTYSKIKEKARKKLNEYNIKTFSKQTKGVHENELPKFSENEETLEFWKFRDGYVENPKFKSQIEYLQNNKFWKKPEELLLQEHKEFKEEDFDRYNNKKIVLKNKKEKDIILHINNVNFYKGFDPNYIKPFNFNNNIKHIYRWTSLAGKFSKLKMKSGNFLDFIQGDGDRCSNNNKVIKKSKSEINIIDTKKGLRDSMEPFKKPLFLKFGKKNGLKLTALTKVRSGAF